MEQELKRERDYSTSNKIKQIIRQNTDITKRIGSVLQSQEETSAEAMKIDDFAILQKEWECTLPESEARRTVENQINKIVKKTNDFTVLNRYWTKAPPGTKLRELIEERIKEILAEIKDFAILQDHWKCTTSGTRSEELIEERMKEILAEIKDFAILQEHWKSGLPYSKPRRLVEERIYTCLDNNTLDGIDQGTILQWIDQIKKKEVIINESITTKIMKILRSAMEEGKKEENTK